ncbi:hypothetical protein LINGRAHAP2_LOCUS1685, partial [Linum grandiflorum]
LLLPFVFSELSLSLNPLERPNSIHTSLRRPQTTPVASLNLHPPSIHPFTRVSPLFLQKSEFVKFALRVHFLAIFRPDIRMSQNKRPRL